jgi:hypothetical protein
MTTIDLIYRKLAELTDEKIEASTPLRDTGLDSFDLIQLAYELDLPNTYSTKELGSMSLIDYARLLDEQNPDPLIPQAGPVS